MYSPGLTIHYIPQIPATETYIITIITHLILKMVLGYLFHKGSILEFGKTVSLTKTYTCDVFYNQRINVYN